MRLRGVLTLLAIIAALLGAPPSASAATNVLSAGEATPASGTTATLFRIRVTYEGRFPAAGVEAIVGGQVVPMALVAGSTTDGVWEARVALPVGAWPVTFAAVAPQGPDPTLVGPTLIVTDILGATPEPAESRAADDAGAARTHEVAEPAPEPAQAPGTQPTEPVPAPAEAPASGGTAGNDGAPSAPTPSAEPAGPGDAAPGADGGTAGGQDDRGGMTPRASAYAAPVNGGPDATAGVAGAPLEPGSPASPQPGVATEDWLGADFVRLRAVWAAMLLVAGAFMLGLLVRRRRRDASEPETIGIGADTEALLERRALRRARTLLPDDEIVASLGIDHPEPTSRRPGRRRARRQRGGDAP